MRALAALLVLSLAAPALADSATVVARVNDAPITEGQVNAVVKGVISGRKQPPPSEEIATLSAAALESLIDLELLAQAAQQQGVTISDAEVDAEIARARARFRDPKQYDQLVARSGLSREQLRADTRKTLLVDTLLTRVVWKDVHVTPEQVRAYYDEHRTQLGDKPFDTLRPAIERALLDEARDKARDTYVAELRKTARIQRP